MDFYYSYWCQKKSDFPANQGARSRGQGAREYRQPEQTSCPLPLAPCPLPLLLFRVEGSHQVDSIIAGTAREMVAFSDVASRCEAIINQIPEAQRTFFPFNSFNSSTQRKLKYLSFFQKNHQNIWLFERKAVPLHPIYAAEARKSELRDGSAPRSNPL